MRFFVIFLVMFSCFSTAEAKPYPDILKDEKASAWLKTQKWPQYIIDEWVRISALPNGLSIGLDNPLCHVYAAENNLIAGQEGLGKYPENPKKIIPVKWKEYPEKDGIKRSLTMFDVNNNGKPLVLERTVADDDSWRAGFYSEISSFKELNALRKKEGDKVYNRRTRFINELAICNVKPYNSFSTISFFTYDDEAYIKIRCYGPSDYKDVIARYDNGEKKRVCVYEGYENLGRKNLDIPKKRFSAADENMRNSLAENRAFYLRGTSIRQSLHKRMCNNAKKIGDDFVEVLNTRLSPRDKCPVSGKKAVSKSNKITKKIKNTITIYSINGETLGSLWNNDEIIDPNGNIIGKKKGNKIIGLGGNVFGIIEE